MKKFKGDYFFDGKQFMSADKVLICEADGAVKDIVSLDDAGDNVEVLDGMLAPGWVNAHCHTELSHLKGKIEKKKGLVAFVQAVMGTREQTEEKEALIEAGIETLKENGIVAVGDICNNLDSLAAKKASDIYFHNFIEVTGFIPSTALPRLEAAKKILQSFKENLPTSRSKSTLAPHAPYSVSDRLFSMVNIATAGAITTMHNQESAEENKFFEDKEGDFLKLYKALGIDIDFFETTYQSSIQSVLPVFREQQQLLLVHNIFTSDKDLFFIKKYAAQFLNTVHFVLCPNANLYIEDTLPNVAMLRDANVNICVGTDSLASNNGLSILSELQVLHKANPAIPVEELLQWGTLNGATALGISERFGSFEKGKKPGINLLSHITDKKIGENASTLVLL